MFKKNMLVITVLFLMGQLLSCQTNDDLKIIDQFITKVILDESFNIENISDYLSIGEDTSKYKVKDLYLVLQTNIDAIRQSLNSCESDYKIDSHYSVDRLLLDNYKLDYPDYEDVYYLFCDNKVVMPIIIKEGKIISFFTSLKKAESQHYKPWLLN